MTPSKHQFVGKKVKLGELCEIYSGGTPKRSVSEYWTGGNVPWVKIGDITEKYVSSTEECITQAGLNNSSAKLFKPGTLLYSIFASIGAVGILNILAATNQAIAGLVIRDNSLDHDFLYHYLKSREVASKTSGRGVAQSNINLTILRNMQVPVPPLVVQKEIVQNLEIVSRQLKMAKLQLSKLDSLVKSRFVEMFGDPIDGTFWAKRKLSNLYEVKSSKRIYAREQTKDGVPFLRLADIGSLIDSGISDSGLFISEERFEELRSKGLVPNPGDVLVTARGTLGRCYIIKPSDCFYFQDGMITWLAAIESSPLPSYLLAVFNNPHFIEELNRNCSGTTVKYLSISDLANVAIPVPPLELQHEFETFVTQVDKSRFGGMLHLLNSLSGIMHASFFSVADTD
ncbi:restriction endonuclease subunit S [Bifidobacterium pseudocatenulatum]|uniref:restriction endonuclease subunit S n=1 Tax=Bifidobacterium pseudocatenulatum TaxID=28026 RepID=UPI001896B4E3|nr:restriction endonuclease subunit S [Bifidobacterium pseudocatenulatum]